MKLTVLGSGTLVARVDRGSPGFYLEIGDKKVLMDMGPGTLRQLARAGKDYRDVDILTISHLHPDHVSDFAAFIQALNWTPDFTRKKKLTVIASEEFKSFYNILQKIFPDVIPQPNTFKLEILSERKIEFNDFSVELKQGNHSPASAIVKFKEQEKTLVYTADTAPDKTLASFAGNCDLLVTECSHTEASIGGAHHTPRTAAEMAQAVGAKKLFLTHFYPPVEKVDILKIVGKYYKGKAILAKDFLSLEI